MRAHTFTNAFRMGMIIAAAAGTTMVASEASAATSCFEDAADCSTGTSALKVEADRGLDTTIDSGWMGPSVVQARALIKIDPVKNGGPLYTVDMPKGAVLEASWPDKQNFVLKAATGSQSDGSMKVRHTLTPSVDVKVDVFGLKATFAFDANKLVNKIPGARFNYDSQATQAFAPWAFGGVDTKLNAPSLDGATLFSVGFDKFPDIVANNMDGELSLKATTKPTFSYRTTKVMLSGASKDLAAEGETLTLPIVDGDYLEVMAAVEGEVKVSGEMDIQPYVRLTRVLGVNGIDVTMGAPAIVKKAYTVPAQKVVFPSQLVHIPLPNVHVPGKGVDLGDVKSGGSATKTVTIENSGEKSAQLTFKSDDAKFEVPSGTITVQPKSTYELKVKFRSDGPGAAASTITVSSNDPDSPEQSFKIGANGAEVGDTDNAPGSTPKASEAGEDGCGCKAAGGTSKVPGYAGFGLLSLGLAALVRRRRSAA